MLSTFGDGQVWPQPATGGLATERALHLLHHAGPADQVQHRQRHSLPRPQRLHVRLRQVGSRGEARVVVRKLRVDGELGVDRRHRVGDCSIRRGEGSQDRQASECTWGRVRAPAPAPAPAPALALARQQGAMGEGHRCPCRCCRRAAWPPPAPTGTPSPPHWRCSALQPPARSRPAAARCWHGTPRTLLSAATAFVRT